jgi:uncharacterized membrane protein
VKFVKRFVIGNLDLLLSILAAVAFLILMHYQVLLPVRRMLSLLLLLFIPGYLVLAVLYPQRQDLAVLERGYLSIAVSLAISILVGMGLNTSIIGRGLFLFPETLTAFVILFSYLAFLRRLWLEVKGFTHKRQKSMYGVIRDPKFVVYFGFAAIALGTFYYLSLFQNNSQAVSTTQMYIQRGECHTNSINREINTEEFESLRLVLRNYERQPVDYDLVELIEGEEFEYLGNVHLQPDEEWSVIREEPQMNGSKITYFVYKSTDYSTPYREVYIRLEKKP